MIVGSSDGTMALEVAMVAIEVIVVMIVDKIYA